MNFRPFIMLYVVPVKYQIVCFDLLMLSYSINFLCLAFYQKKQSYNELFELDD